MVSLPFLAQVSVFENNFLPSTRDGFELLTFDAGGKQSNHRTNSA